MTGIATRSQNIISTSNPNAYSLTKPHAVTVQTTVHTSSPNAYANKHLKNWSTATKNLDLN